VRPQRTSGERLIAILLCVAVLSLFVGDTWAALLLLHPPHTYQAGSWPDLFRFTCYLFIPLISLVRLRLMPFDLPPRSPVAARATRLTWRDVLAGLRFGAPSAAVMIAAVAILMHATEMAPSPAGLSAPEVVAIALLLLATLRPGVVYLEQEQLR